jgi:hypothetical protein
MTKSFEKHDLICSDDYGENYDSSIPKNTTAKVAKKNKKCERCKDCKGSQICIHNRYKRYCLERD